MDVSELQGTIQKVERKTKGTGYRARFSVQVDGDRNEDSRVFDERQGAVQWLVKKNYEMNEGMELNTDSVLFGDWLDQWLEDFIEATCKDSTVDRYHSVIKTHIKPELGHIHLEQLATTQIQKLYGKMQSATYEHGTGGAKSSSTINTVHKVINKSLKDATQMRPPLLDSNPAKAATPPANRNKDIAYLEPDELPSFIRTAEKVGSYSPLYLMGIATGMRPGELLGLKWEDLNWKDGTVTVRHAVTRSRKRGPSISTPKSNKSRTIPLPQFVLSKLDDHQNTQQMIRSSYQGEWKYPNLVFCTRKGTIIRHSNLLRQWNRIVDKGGFDANLTPHSMRHSHATWTLSQGTHPKVVADRLGHSSIRITLDRYSHVIQGLESEITEQLQAEFAEAV